MDLGSLMNLRPDEIASLELPGTIQDVAPPPPPLDILKKIATDERPDVAGISTRRYQGGSRRSTGQGERLQRRVRSLATLYVSGQLSVRLEEPVLPGRWA